MSQTVVGIVGGTGLYELDGLSNVEEHIVDTPFGNPSSPITSAELDGVRLLFLARHGRGHVFTPSEINYRANIFALKALGAQWCISVSAVGSLLEERKPGDVVFPDQYIDRTKARPATFYGGGVVVHVPFADPVCPVLKNVLEESAEELAVDSDRAIYRDGTYICMEGPAFSTRAESNWHRSWGASLIGMTALPEAKLAREAEIGYATMAMVTDYDCWRSREADVDVAEILATMANNVNFAKQVIAKAAPKLKEAKPCEMVSNALACSIITAPENVPAEVKEKLAPLLGKYLAT